MKLLRNEQQESYENEEGCYICKEETKDKHAKYRKYRKVRDHCHIGGIQGYIEVLPIAYVI